MALNTSIVELIRQEIGDDQDFADDNPHDPNTQLGNLEDIYNTADQGNGDILRTALIVWRKRRASYVSRGFDVTAAGSLMARRQRMLELDRTVKEYELLVDTTFKQRNQEIQSNYQQNESASSEFA